MSKAMKLLGVALVVAVVSVAFVVGAAWRYYTWRIGYTIYPLTANSALSIGIPPTSGATYASNVQLNNTVPNIKVTKNVYVHFMVDTGNTSALAANYWNLSVSIKYSTPGWANMTLVTNGLGDGTVDVPTTLLSPGTYPITIYATYWTNATLSNVSSSFVINIYALEG
jgi:hypothetical protein